MLFLTTALALLLLQPWLWSSGASAQLVRRFSKVKVSSHYWAEQVLKR